MTGNHGPLVAPSDAPSRVLAVDDDRFMRAYLEAVLREASIDVVAVEADEAARLIDHQDFDLIICDWTMPEMSGQEFLAMVRSHPRFDLTPFIFLTVSEELDNLVAGLGGGADDYIRKPFEPSEFVARVTSRLNRARQSRRRHTEFTDIETFASELDRELTRFRRGGMDGVLAVVDIPSLKAVEMELGDRERRAVLETIAAAMSEAADPLDIIGATRFGDLAVLMPGSGTIEAADRLRAMATRAAALTTHARGRQIRPVPMIGFTEFQRRTPESREEVLRRAAGAAEEARLTQDLQPRRWLPDDGPGRRNDHHPAREAIQVGSSFTLGIVLPFVLYVMLDRFGFDISWPIYLATVAALVSTAILIWTEGVFATRHPGAPKSAGGPAPPASAIICAYLPNEASTIVETLESFFRVDYPAGLQVILAYNTPRDLPIEEELRGLAEAHPEFELMRVEGSNSKAQNLNAALSMASGDFIGVFDADHQPDPDAFQRAWKWLSNGYDVVQGHCLVRNPDATFLARMVAVEFETIYAVNHPGRWLRDGFGIFGGSNGYWKTEVLHMTRMRGSMLTEDIDSSMRVLEAGGRIASDPGLISRELATTTPRQLWNQRLRWAQGWTQVSMSHLWQMLRIPRFGSRQKFGVFMLLFQREIYPWLSIQIFPLLAFWWVRGDLIDWLVPVFVAATIFTTSVGPGMTYLAYRLAHPTIRKKSWFFQYALFSILFYSEAKNVIARVAHIKEALGETSWRVTPRSADPAQGSVPSSVLSSPTTDPSDGTHHGIGGPDIDRFDWRTWIDEAGDSDEEPSNDGRLTSLPIPGHRAPFVERFCPDLDIGTYQEAVSKPLREAETRAARKLMLEGEELALLSFYLWDRSFLDERDRRAGASQSSKDPESLRARRGHATRELTGELDEYLSERITSSESDNSSRPSERLVATSR